MTIKEAYNPDEFWSFIESKIYCNVPQYLKNLLRIKGLDDAITIQLINDEVIEHLEVFVKNGGLIPFIPDNADLKDFFGIFEKIQDKFKIVPGHKVLLKYIVKFVVQQTNAKGPEFYKR